VITNKTYREIQHLFGQGKSIEELAKHFFPDVKIEQGRKKILRIIQLPPCITCQDYRDCSYGVGKESYSYAEIRWCPYQCIFIIQHREELLEGNLPYLNNDSYIFTGFRDEAYFTKPEEIIAELELRLKSTKRDGKTLIEEIDRGYITIELLSSAARDALMYIKGIRRKKQTYAQWLAGRKYRNGKRV
jgi:hypothetical protein